MATDLKSFAPYVRTEVSDCPELIIIDAILRAGIEFCQRAKAVVGSAKLNTSSGVARYLIDVDADLQTEPSEVLKVSRGINDELENSSHYEFLARGLEQTSGTPQFYYLDGDELVLGAIPEGVEELSVTYTLAPTLNATSLPDIIYQKYREEIAAGAKFKLMSMANKPWSNLKQAGINLMAFNSAIDKANLLYAKGGGKKRLRTKPHSF